MEYASNGKANTGVALGAVGTGLGAINALGGLGAMAFGGGRGYGHGYDIGWERELEHRIEDTQRMADKDMLIAALQAEKTSNEHDIEVYKQVRRDIDKELSPIREDIRELQKFERDQLIYNGVNTTTQGYMKAQIAELMGLTRRRIPNDSVCPGWGPVEVTPAEKPTP